MSTLETVVDFVPTDPSGQMEWVEVRCSSLLRRLTEVTSVVEAQQMAAHLSTLEHALREVDAISDVVRMARIAGLWAERFVPIAARNAIPFESFVERRGWGEFPSDLLREAERWNDYRRFLRPANVHDQKWRVWWIFADASHDEFASAIRTCISADEVTRKAICRVLAGAAPERPEIPKVPKSAGRTPQARWHPYVRLAAWCARESQVLRPCLAEIEMTGRDLELLQDAVDAISALIEDAT